MLIESPRWTSSRIGPTSVIVAEQPFPPDSEVSRESNEDTVPTCSTSLTVEYRGIPIPVNMAIALSEVKLIGDADHHVIPLSTKTKTPHEAHYLLSPIITH